MPHEPASHRHRPLAHLGALATGLMALLGLRRHGGAAMGRQEPGGILIKNPGAYDSISHRFLFGSLFGPIAADIAAATTPGSRVLEVGCGPGHLSLRLAREHGLNVTALDLDPAMIERARANARRFAGTSGAAPAFVVGDVASLPFADGSFDLVVSTLSMHHWSDPPAGLGEIGRVLKPDGRALIWDIRSGALPFHRHVPDPLDHVRESSVRLVSTTPWRWPWRFKLLQRFELAPTSR